MKRKLALLMCAILTLSGCNGSEISDVSIAPDSAETEPPEETLSVSEAGGTSDAVAPANENRAENSDRLVPELSDQKVTFDFSGEVSLNKIKNEIGYDIDFDVTALDCYSSCVQYVGNELSGEELEALRERNYIAEVSPRFIPLCIEEADWLAVQNYHMYGLKGSFMSRMLLIKDGEAVMELEPIELEQIYSNNVNNAVYSRGELYINSCQSLRKVDLRTGETQIMIAYDRPISYGLITAVSDDYIVCGNGAQAVLVCETGEVFYPGIYWAPLGSEPLRLIGDRIEYKEDGAAKVYDIKNRVLSEDSTLAFADGFSEKNNETWSVCFEAVTDDSGGVTCFTTIKAINISDGSERVYDLKALNSELTGDIISDCGGLFLDGDRLWINIGDYFTGVLNLATGKAAEAERRFYDISRVSEGLMKITEEVGGDYIYSLARANYPV